MHEQAARALGIRYHYHLIEVAGAGRDELRALLDSVRRLGFAGVNVTFPYKEAVVDLLDELSPGAAAMGAITPSWSAIIGWSVTIRTPRVLRAP
jgi:shikimate dehydrogenase